MNRIIDIIIGWSIILGLPMGLIGACMVAENVFVNGIQTLIGVALIIVSAILFATMLVLQGREE